MAKTLSAAATAIWKRKHGRYEIYKIEYRRRIFNDDAFRYEADWTEVSQSELPLPGSISFRMDPSSQNIAQVSNVTMEMPNDTGKWTPNQFPPSIFYEPETPGISGSGVCEPYLTKFRISYGYTLDDGTTEVLPIFVGYLTDFTARGSSSTISYVLSGSEILLQQYDAQNLSTAFTLENCSPSTGDGSNKDFLTTSIGVWKITDVQKNGVSLTQGTDYTLSQMDENGPAKISLVAAPTAGHTMKCTGYKWRAAQTIQSLVTALFQASPAWNASESGGSYTIESVVVPGSTSGSKTIDTKANWDAGTILANITSTLSDGDISIAWRIAQFFTGADGTIPAGWSAFENPSSGGAAHADIDTNRLLISANVPGSGLKLSSAFAWLATPGAYGTWQFDANFDSSPVGGAYCQMMFICDTSKVLGYGLYANYGGDGLLTFRKSGVTLASLGTIPVGTKTWKVTRDAAGVFNIYKDTVLQATVTDNEITSCFQITALAIATNTVAASTVNTFDNLYWSPEIGSVALSTAMVYESASFDILSTPTAWGRLDHSEELNGGSIAYATASSTNGVSWDSYVAISSDGTIQSALKRYFKIRATFTLASNWASPVISSLVAHFSVSSISVAIANFKGKTAYTAIQDLAKIADYEWGFKGNGDFFFRAKSTSGSPSLTLDQDNAILELTSYKPGWEKIVNIGQVTYGASGQYYSEYNGTSAGEAMPTSEQHYNARTQAENVSILLANDVALGSGRAQVLYQNYHLPRARVVLRLWMTPQVDLSDIVSVSYYRDPKMENQIIGDNLLSWGDAFTSFGDGGNVLLRAMRMLVTGVTYNIKEGTTDLELSEVI